MPQDASNGNAFPRKAALRGAAALTPRIRFFAKARGSAAAREKAGEASFVRA